MVAYFPEGGRHCEEEGGEAGKDGDGPNGGYED